LWTLFAEPIEISEAQIRAFRRLHVRNNRPLQPLGDRQLKFSR
jgi:carbonic anhydrase